MTKIEIKHGKDLWQKVKEEFESQDLEKDYFYTNYLKDESGFESFMKGIIRDGINLSKPVSELVYDKFMEEIGDARFNSTLIMMQIDSITDKYIGDK